MPYRNRLYTVLLPALCFSAIAAAQPPYCTQNTITGTYALAYEGAVFAKPPGASQAVPLPGAGLAIVSVDSEGVIASAGYQTVGGAMAYYPAMPGTIKVNSDCTGTLMWTGGATATVAVMDGGDTIHSLVVQSPMGPTVIYGTWDRISRVPETAYAAQCSESSVFGTYAIRQHGYAVLNQAAGPQPSFVPGSALGITAVARDGTAEGTGTMSIGGQIMTFTSTDGAVQVKPDCTGTVSFTAVSQGRNLGQFQGWFVVLDGGDTLWTIELSTPLGKPATLGTMTRISRTTATGK
jgi:hypothetical protein